MGDRLAKERTSPMSTDTRSPAIRKRAIYIFCISAFLFGLGQFHRMSGAVTIPPIAADLGLAVGSLGFIAAVLFFTSACLQIPNGLLLDRFGPRRLLPVYVGFSVLGCLILAHATTYEELILSRMLLGAGFSVTMISAYILFARWFPADRFATVASWMMAASSAGSLLSSYPLAYFIEEFGWRPAYLIVAAVTVVAIGLGFLIVRDAPPGFKNSDQRPLTLKDSILGYKTIIVFPRFFFMLCMGFVAFGPATAILGMWGGPYLETFYGLNGVERGEILLAMVVAAILGALFFGPMDRIFKSRKAIIMVAVLGEVILFSCLGLIPDLPLWAICVIFVLIAFLQQHYVVLAAHCRATFPDHLVGRANSTLNLTSILGVGFMQSLVGWGLALFPDFGYEASFLAIASLLVLAMLLYSASTEVLPVAPEKN